METQITTEAENVNVGWWASAVECEEVTVTLRRREDGEEKFLERFHISPETMPTIDDLEDAVNERHGGGIYFAIVAGERGQFAKRVKLSISGLPKRQAAEEKPQAKEAEGLGALLMQMQERSDARFEKILEKMADKPSGDDELTRLERYAGIFSKNAQPVQKAEKSLIEQAMEKQILRFMEDGMGAPKEEAGFGWVKDLVMQFGPALVAASTGQAGDETAVAVTAPDGQDAVMNKLSLLLAGMVQLAGYAVPPEATVEKIKAQAGAHWPALLAVIQRPDAVDMAAQLVPAVTNHRAWFEDFKAAVLGGPKKVEVIGGVNGRRGGTDKAASSALDNAKRPARRKANA